MSCNTVPILSLMLALLLPAVPASASERRCTYTFTDETGRERTVKFSLDREVMVP